MCKAYLSVVRQSDTELIFKSATKMCKIIVLQTSTPVVVWVKNSDWVVPAKNISNDEDSVPKYKTLQRQR